MHDAREEKNCRTNPNNSTQKVRNGTVGEQCLAAPHLQRDKHSHWQGYDIAHKQYLEWRVARGKGLRDRVVDAEACYSGAHQQDACQAMLPRGIGILLQNTVSDALGPLTGL